MDQAELLKSRRREILAICGKHGARNVRVFGSCARREHSATSDIDILVNLDSTELKGLRYFGVLEELEEELEAILGVRVDVVDESGLKERVRDEVLSEARVL